MRKQRRRIPHELKIDTIVVSSSTLVSPTQPSLCSGAAGLWQSLLNLFTFAPQQVTLLKVQMDDRLALLGDAQRILNDARLAHQRLLQNYPELIH